jgi:hypothetical protein
MKKKIFMACATLVVSAAAVVGVKAYNYYSMSPLMRANLEALSQDEIAKSPYYSIPMECLRCNNGTITGCMWDCEGRVNNTCKPGKCSNNSCTNVGYFMQ